MSFFGKVMGLMAYSLFVLFGMVISLVAYCVFGYLTSIGVSCTRTVDANFPGSIEYRIELTPVGYTIVGIIIAFWLFSWLRNVMKRKSE